MSAGSPVSLRTACSSGMTPRSRTHVPSRSVGSGASHSWSTCAPASERPSATWSCVSRWPTASTSSLAMYARKRVVEILGDRDLAHHVERAAAALAREVAHPPALQLGEALRLGDLERLPARLHRRLLEIGGRRAPATRDRGTRRGARRGSTFISSPNTVPVLRLYGVGHRELHRERPRRDLRPDLRAVARGPARAAATGSRCLPPGRANSG